MRRRYQRQPVCYLDGAHHAARRHTGGRLRSRALRRLPILVGGIIGYLVYLLFANGFGLGKSIDFTSLNNAAWIGLPNFTAPSFHLNAMALIAPVAIILVAENLGHVKAVAAMTGRNLDPYLGRAFLGDGVSTIVSGFGGGLV